MMMPFQTLFCTFICFITEQMRQQKRAMNRTQRELGRDQSALERQEKQLEMEIKKMAKQGNKQVYYY